MHSDITLDTNFSTTRLLSKEQPTLTSEYNATFKSMLFLPSNETRQGEGGLRTQGYFKKSYKDKPLVTVITVVYNGETYLEETILSVINQTYDNVEYIIIDGGSTDGTLKIIKKYKEQIDYWVTEPDDGIYDAMNKGLCLSYGEVIGIINADDWYKHDTIAESVHSLQENHADYSVGNIQKVPSNIIAKAIFPLIKNHIYQEMMYPHISAFVKRNVYKKTGLFNTNYKISADFDMALRIHKQNFKLVYLDMIQATVVEDGISGDTRSKKEYLDIVIQQGKSPISAYATYYLHIFKYYIIKILPKPLVAKILKLRKSRFQYAS